MRQRGSTKKPGDLQARDHQRSEAGESGGQPPGGPVELVLKDGTVLKEEVKLPKGDPEIPATDADMENKLRFCAEDVLPEQRQRAILKTVKKA